MTAAVATLGVDPVVADIEYDWLAAGAAVDGNAYDPVKTLALEDGVQIRVVRAADGISDVVHPRTPGALLLLVPLRVLPYDFLVAFITGASAAVIVGFALTWLRDVDSPSPRRDLILLLALVSAPVMMTFAYGGQGLLVAALIFGAWLTGARDRVLVPAAFAAAAIVLKLFPAVLLIHWWVTGRRKPVYATVGVVIVLNLLGLLMPGVALGDALGAFLAAIADFTFVPTNGSLSGLMLRLGVSIDMAALVSFVLLVIFLALVFMRRVPRSLGLVLGVTLLLLPISWTSYDVVLVPFAMVVASTAGRGRFAAAIPLVLWGVVTIFWFREVPVITQASFVARLSFVVLIGITLTRTPAGLAEANHGFPAVLASDVVGTDRAAVRTV